MYLSNDSINFRQFPPVSKNRAVTAKEFHEQGNSRKMNNLWVYLNPYAL